MLLDAVICSANICFLKQWLVCWLLSSSSLALIWWRPVFSNWMEQAPISLLCGFCFVADKQLFSTAFWNWLQSSILKKMQIFHTTAFFFRAPVLLPGLLSVYYTYINACPGTLPWLGLQRWCLHVSWNFCFPWHNLSWMGSIPQGTAE